MHRPGKGLEVGNFTQCVRNCPTGSHPPLPPPTHTHLVLGLLFQAPPLVQGLGDCAPCPRPSARLLLLCLGHQQAGLVVVLAALHVALFGLAKVGLCLLLWAWEQRDHFQTVLQLSCVLAFPTSHPSSQTPSQAPPPPMPHGTIPWPSGQTGTCPRTDSRRIGGDTYNGTPGGTGIWCAHLTAREAEA